MNSGRWIRRGSFIFVYGVDGKDVARDDEVEQFFGTPGSILNNVAAAPRASVAAPRARNVYPPFTPPRASEMAEVRRLAAMLQQQTALRIDANQILEAPWIGRNTRYSTSEGWLRNARAFWTAFARHAPRSYALLQGGRKVTAAYARAMGWPTSTIGQQLVHHHIYNSRFVVPLPANAHGAQVHRKASVVATP